MKNLETICLIVCVVVILIVLVLFYALEQPRIYKKSSLNDKYYLVKGGRKSQEVADTLATLNVQCEKLINFVGSKTNNKFSKNIYNLKSKYTTLSENIDLSSTSYTLNKGDEVAMCITARNKEEKIYDINTLMFVCIHELAHIGCESVGHTKEFEDFFRFLLKEAVICGVYRYIDYSVAPKEYCGMTITNTPLNS